MFYAKLSSRDTIRVRLSLIRYLGSLKVSIQNEEDIVRRLELSMEYNDIVEILNRKFNTNVYKIG